MTGHTNLFRRGVVYYFRARVPQDIIDTYGKAEEKFSLKTKNYKEAIKRVRLESAKVETEFESHRRELKRISSPALTEVTPKQLQHITSISLMRMMTRGIWVSTRV